jgi:divalent metal cation (Fe/Co/Zn/Cd) transporter
MTFADAFGPDVLIVLFILVCGIAIPVWAVVDAARRPATAFYGAGSNKAVWIVVIAVAWFFGLGFFLGGFYLLFTRPKVRRRMEGIR